MKIKIIFKKIVLWLPSVVITLFFVPNALNKIFESNQLDKMVSNRAVIIGTGVVLLIGTALFLYNKTILWGTCLLALYMTCIVCIHMYKGKPHEVAILIVMATVFAAYIRKPELFNSPDACI